MEIGFRCGRTPLSPPGVDIEKNMEEASKHINPFWFYNQVNTGGPWDFKQRGSQYENFGNFHYGAVGTTFGFSEEILLRAAGAVQIKDKTNKPEYGSPLGGPPYGDDPKDQAMIKAGIKFAKCKNNNPDKPCSN